MVVHRRHDEAPAFAEGYYVLAPDGSLIAGPLETADEAEEAAPRARDHSHPRIARSRR
jgi:hypothetical protein